jgi:splicing factor 4
VGLPQQSSTSNPSQQAATVVLSDKINVSVVTPGRLKLVRTNLQQDRGYKYIEPVRKKSEREALQSTDCRQCKKFYDAVLAKDANGVVESRCKHHDASRHRYKFAPPATPEGFWNIGFDSDL